MNKLKLALLALALALPSMAFATDVDPMTAVQTISTNSQTLFNTVAGVVIAVVSFGILLGFAKLLKRK